MLRSPLLLVFALLLPAAAAAQSMTERALQSVVSVLPQHERGQINMHEPEGSGVVIDQDCTIVTAAHVVRNAKRILVRDWRGNVAEAALLHADFASDLAFLCLAETALKKWSLPVLQLNTKPYVTMPVCAIGNAYGQDLSVTCGIVSALNRSGTGFNAIEDFVQTDAAVNPGMSGGALVDDRGQLVGVLAAIFTKSSDANIGVNFAISSALTGRGLELLRRKGEIRWPAEAMLLDTVKGNAHGLIKGAQILEFIDGRGATTSGFEIGDVIIQADDLRIGSVADWRAALALHQAEDSLDVTIMRARDDGYERLHMRYTPMDLP